jgi:hypothetical protein
MVGDEPDRDWIQFDEKYTILKMLDYLRSSLCQAPLAAAAWAQVWRFLESSH